MPKIIEDVLIVEINDEENDFILPYKVNLIWKEENSDGVLSLNCTIPSLPFSIEKLVESIHQKYQVPICTMTLTSSKVSIPFELAEKIISPSVATTTSLSAKIGREEKVPEAQLVKETLNIYCAEIPTEEYKKITADASRVAIPTLHNRITAIKVAAGAYGVGALYSMLNPVTPLVLAAGACMMGRENIAYYAHRLEETTSQINNYMDEYYGLACTFNILSTYVKELETPPYHMLPLSFSSGLTDDMQTCYFVHSALPEQVKRDGTAFHFSNNTNGRLVLFTNPWTADYFIKAFRNQERFDLLGGFNLQQPWTYLERESVYSSFMRRKQVSHLLGTVGFFTQPLIDITLECLEQASAPTQKR